MRKIFVLFVFCFSFLTIFVSKALATTGQVSGKIVNNNNVSVSQSDVVLIDPLLGTIVAATKSNNDGNYFLILPQGIYTITVFPPTHSMLQQWTKTFQPVGVHSVVNIRLLALSQNAEQITHSNMLYPIIIVFILFILIGIIGYLFWKRK